MSESWRSMTAADLGRGIGSGEIDPVDLTETFLAAIDAHPLRDRVYQLTTPRRARAEAKAAALRAKNRTRRHLLDGVPISWKDLYDVAGEKTRASLNLNLDTRDDVDTRPHPRARADPRPPGPRRMRGAAGGSSLHRRARESRRPKPPFFPTLTPSPAFPQRPSHVSPFPRFPVSPFPRFEPLGVVLVFRVVSTLSDPSEERRPVPLAG